MKVKYLFKMSKIKKSTDIVQKENVIQAVLVADNFNEYFSPISDEIPMVNYYINLT